MGCSLLSLLQKWLEYFSEVSRPAHVEPGALQPFAAGGLDVRPCVVDEEALGGWVPCLLHSKAVYRGVGFCQVHLLREPDVVEEVGAGVSCLREACSWLVLESRCVL